MTAAHRTAAAFLRSAGLVAVVMAVIAGILGMHVLTGTHALTAATAGTHTDHHPDASGHHASHQDSPGMPDPGAIGQDGVRTTAWQCSDPGACCSMQAMTAACTPSAKTATMAAPPPGSLVLGVSDNTTLASDDAGLWTYLPGSPSPCELSISRT